MRHNTATRVIGSALSLRQFSSFPTVQITLTVYRWYNQCYKRKQALLIKEIAIGRESDCTDCPFSEDGPVATNRRLNRSIIGDGCLSAGDIFRVLDNDGDVWCASRRFPFQWGAGIRKRISCPLGTLIQSISRQHSARGNNTRPRPIFTLALIHRQFLVLFRAVRFAHLHITNSVAAFFCSNQISCLTHMYSTRNIK